MRLPALPGLKLLNDRASLKTEDELNNNRIRELETDADAKLAEVESLRGLNSDLKFEVARKNEQIQSLAISVDELRLKLMRSDKEMKN